MNKSRNNYLKENEDYYTNLIWAWKKLDFFDKELSIFKIYIKEKPWYKNILEIHIPNAIQFYKNCKCVNFDYDEASNKWIRSDFKSFMSEVEKFTKFIVKTILKIDKNIDFNNSINKLDIIVQEYQFLFNEKWIESIESIKDNLHRWRQNYNENKHDEEKIDDNFFIEKRSGYVLGIDVLEYVSDFLYHIMIRLLETLVKILNNNAIIIP